MTETQLKQACPLPVTRYEQVILAHGGGGKLTQQLIDKIFFPAFKNKYLAQEHDGAVIPVRGDRLAMTTDSFVVNPLFFPGGNIGDLAVNGTVNDLACCGAIPKYLTAGFILEEGFPMADLQRIVNTMSSAARKAGVEIITGDTKVVEKGHGDGLFISTSGLGEKIPGTCVSGKSAKPGDIVLVTGTMGDHGITILSQREGLGFEAQVQSDTAPLNHITEALLTALGEKVHVLRDPTRGGLATTLNEIAAQSKVSIEIDEQAVPIHPAVASACEFLGLDPLYIANEGKLIVIVEEDVAQEALSIIRSCKYGENAAVIGRVSSEQPGFVSMKTAIGGKRLVDWLNSDPLPRIC